MNDCNVGTAKKSLMNSLETLNVRAKTLSDLSDYSNKLVRKFTNPMPEPEMGEKQLMGQKGDILDRQPDLIDLFNFTAERMQKEIDNIGSNIDRLMQMVD